MLTLIESNEVSTIVNPIDQVQASAKMKSSYGFTSSRAILDAFSAHGWNEVSSQYSRTNKVERSGFQKHLVRLENPEFSNIKGLSNDNNSRPQLVLLNSHDGSSALNLFWGVIRMACLNGIISGNAISSFRLIHSKSITEKLPDAIEYMLNNFNKFTAQIETLQSLKFTESGVNELIKTVYDARLSGVGKVLAVDYSLNSIRRHEDSSLDAYTVFNRIQETLMRGGIQYRAERNRLDERGNVIQTYIVDTKTRKLSSITQQVKLNQLVYDKALELAV